MAKKEEKESMYYKKAKRLFAAVLAAGMLAGLTACAGSTGESAASAAVQTEAVSEASDSVQQAEADEASQAAAESDASAADAAADSAEAEKTLVRFGALKGPTTMGIVNMMEDAEAGALPFSASFFMGTTADELTAQIVSGDLDVALIPANLAAVLYNRTEGGIQVLNVNTLGVLYGVTGDESVASLADLAGKTVYMTGQGSTPEYAVRYILAQNGLADEVNLEFRSEATEIAALLKEDPMRIAILPQPFATVCQLQNDAVKEFLNLTEEWKKCPDSGASELLTGVTIVRKEFAEAHADDGLLEELIKGQEASVAEASENPDHTAELIASYGIVEKAAVAKAALPKCGLTCISGAEMKEALSGYLTVLYDAEPKSVGGALPGDDFYRGA